MAKKHAYRGLILIKFSGGFPDPLCTGGYFIPPKPPGKRAFPLLMTRVEVKTALSFNC